MNAKHYHSTDGATYLGETGYTYNERGWLTNITLINTGSTPPAYAESIVYNGGSTPQYNGNIAQFSYQSPTTGTTNTVAYNYDKLNRLVHSASTAGTVDEVVGYDRMGNITRLARSAPQAAKFGYTYINSGKSNLLTAVNDTLGNSRAYTYDGNGNALGDGMGKTISYNMLNLPAQVSTGTTVLATYTYDADGSKLANVSSANGSWYYDNGIVYSNTHGTGTNVIDFIQTEEGKATLAAGATQYAYSYDLKDYLGNIRASFDNTGAGGTSRTLQENDYYSFGLDEQIYAAGAQKRYLYNGKEKQLDLVNQYDYGARFYDPVIAKWNTIDPKAERSRRWAPYNYVEDNPIRNIDPDGMRDVHINGNEAATAETELQKSVQGQLNLSRDNTTGNFTYTAVPGATLNAAATKLAAAIDDHTVDVKLNATSSNEASTNGVVGNLIVGATKAHI